MREMSNSDLPHIALYSSPTVLENQAVRPSNSLGAAVSSIEPAGVVACL